MSEKAPTLIETIRYFSDEQVCIDTVAMMRWPDGKPVCPKCGGREHYYLASQKRWKCKDKACYRQFSVKAGTVFEDSPIPLDKWLVALWMLTNCKNGISSHELARDLGITQKSAWFMLHRLREAMKDNSLAKMGSNEGGEVEVDEAYVGAKAKNMHYKRKLKIQNELSKIPAWKQTTRYAGKTAVMGMFDRDSRKVRAKVVPNVRRETLQTEILNNIEHGSTIYTDQAVAYDSLKEKYVHETVNHIDSYVRGQVHTNCLENFWSLMKRNLAGTYVAVEPFHLDRYLDEQMFRFNNRDNKSNADRFAKALSQVAGKRLTYSELIGKSPEAF